MLTMTLGSSVGRNFKSPGTRAKGMAMLRGELLKAQGKTGGEDKAAEQDGEKEESRGGRDLNLNTVSGDVRILRSRR